MLGTPGGVGRGQSKQEKGQSWSDRPIILHIPGGATSAATVATKLATVPVLSCAIRKIVVLEPEKEEPLTNVQAAVEALAARLDATTAVAACEDGISIGVRVQTFPASLLKEVLPALEARSSSGVVPSESAVADSPPDRTAWEMRPQASAARQLVCAVARLSDDPTSGLRIGVVDGDAAWAVVRGLPCPLARALARSSPN